MQSDATVVCHNMPNAPDALSFSASDLGADSVSFDFASLLPDAIDGDLEPLMTLISQLLGPDALAQLLAGDLGAQTVSSGLELTDNIDLAGDSPIEVFIHGKAFYLSFDQQAD